MVKEKVKVGIVLGGAEGVYDEYIYARTLCSRAAQFGSDNEIEIETYACNAMISTFTRDFIGVTLHPDKLKGWLEERRAAKRHEVQEVWTNVEWKGTKKSPDWRGSCGLFAVKIALQEYGCDRVILCGVPMDAQRNHFLTGKRWIASHAFRAAWVHHRDRGALRKVRSCSGWSSELLGLPAVSYIVNGEGGGVITRTGTRTEKVDGLESS